MTQEQKDIVLNAAKYEMINTCINYITGVVDKDKLAEVMQRYDEMYHQNELSKTNQQKVTVINNCLGCKNNLPEKGYWCFTNCIAGSKFEKAAD